MKATLEADNGKHRQELQEMKTTLESDSGQHRQEIQDLKTTLASFCESNKILQQKFEQQQHIMNNTTATHYQQPAGAISSDIDR